MLTSTSAALIWQDKRQLRKFDGERSIHYWYNSHARNSNCLHVNRELLVRGEKQTKKLIHDAERTSAETRPELDHLYSV
jgi:hypothetical protein